jgi:hypothetical protein
VSLTSTVRGAKCSRALPGADLLLVPEPTSLPCSARDSGKFGRNRFDMGTSQAIDNTEAHIDSKEGISWEIDRNRLVDSKPLKCLERPNQIFELAVPRGGVRSIGKLQIPPPAARGSVTITTRSLANQIFGSDTHFTGETKMLPCATAHSAACLSSMVGPQ